MRPCVGVLLFILRAARPAARGAGKYMAPPLYGLYHAAGGLQTLFCARGLTPRPFARILNKTSFRGRREGDVYMAQALCSKAYYYGYFFCEKWPCLPCAAAV